MGGVRDWRHAQERLVRYLIGQRGLRSPEVIEAFRTVPRHYFLPDSAGDVAYEDRSVPTLMHDREVLSVAEQPAVVALVAERLALRPGMRVLEVGAGTGFAAAVYATLVGPGSVVCLDVVPGACDAARENLRRAGRASVRVVWADGTFGYMEDAPYDRVVLAAATVDLSLSWVRQLRPEGRLVVPLVLAGADCLLTFRRRADSEVLEGIAVDPVRFVPLRGSFARPPLRRTLDGGWQVQAQHAADFDPAQLLPLLNEPTRRPLGGTAPFEDAWCLPLAVAGMHPRWRVAVLEGTGPAGAATWGVAVRDPVDGGAAVLTGEAVGSAGERRFGLQGAPQLVGPLAATFDVWRRASAPAAVRVTATPRVAGAASCDDGSGLAYRFDIAWHPPAG